ncbi:hypothetical protein [Fibrivirga algicola]|uniref:Uncharacterized protein n=1 Tax=Fibrivirga algicola TaxID=2950420 RepID=A0ABX0QCB7_9BACT|nr:hypothetical protein [Fibrivirga algicola]ARK10949.1 hypothetical protein A6C57_11780 [Fibrella sp. ES10-3-2-2]NID09799.1 hypothetical protein [Fibrivirga algicola]
MSVSSNIRKESTESHAARQMHSTMGSSPDGGMAQLNDKNLDNELPSRLNDRANNTSVAEDVQAIEDTVAAEGDDTTTDSSDQPVLTTDTEYGSEQVRPTHVADADWNRTTEE